MTNTYAKVFGISKNESGEKDWGYIVIDKPCITKEVLANMLRCMPEEVILLTKEQIEKETGDIIT